MGAPVIAESVIEWLCDLASDRPPVSGARIVAGLVHRGRLLCHAPNMMKTHPLQARFSRSAKSIFLHAEINCLVAAQRAGIDPRGTEMVVVRTWADGSTALARPCNGCQRGLAHYGIDRVTYTDDHGAVQSWTLS